MKCNNCGFENNHDANFCLSCKTELTKQPATLTPFAQTVHSALTDKLFLALCIAVSAVAVFSLFSQGINLLAVLATIFLWILFSKAKKGNVDVKNMRNISGTVYAGYVIICIEAIVVTVLGSLSLIAAIVGIAGTFSASNWLIPSDEFEAFLNWLVAVPTLVLSLFIFLVNVRALRKIHRFAKATYQGVDNSDTDVTRLAKSTKTWLWVLAIICALSGIANLISDDLIVEITAILLSDNRNVLGQLSAAAVYIISALLVNKYFLNPTPKTTLTQPTAEPEPVAQTEKPDQPTE